MVKTELIMTGFLFTYILHLFVFLPAPTTITSATPLPTPDSLPCDQISGL